MLLSKLDAIFKIARFTDCSALKKVSLTTNVYLSWGVACLKFNVSNCWVVVNAFMQKYCNKGSFTNSVDPDEMPQNSASHQGLRHLQY